MSALARATGTWWRTRFVPWAYPRGRALKLALGSHWPELAGALLGGVLCALIGCGGRGGPACAPRAPSSAISDGGGQSPRTCEAPR